MKKASFLVSGLLLTSIIFSFPAASGARDLKVAANFVRFNEKYGRIYEARENASGRIVGFAARDAACYGPVCTFAEVDPVPRATALLNEYLAGAQTAGSKFIAEKTEKTENVFHVTFAHYYRGKRVDGSSATVSLNGAEQLVSLNDGIRRITSCSQVMESITPERAEALAAEKIGLVAPRGKTRTSEIIRVKDGAAIDAFKVEIPAREPLGDFVCVVSAAGTVMSAENIMNFATPLGTVYVSNPIRCAVTKEPLENLVYSYKDIRGKYATIGNAAAENSSDHLRPDAAGNYFADPRNTHFDEINAYYHTDRVHGMYSRLGFAGLDKPVPVIVHSENAVDNAFFSPIFEYIEVGDGEKKNDLGKEEAIFYHEYSHYVTFTIVKLTGGEAGALSEAYADYFPASFTNDPAIGEWIMAKAQKPYLRTLENKKHYPEDVNGEPHNDGQIISGALWDLRAAIGAEKADRIAHYSRSYLKGLDEPAFTDGLAGLIAADKELYGGENGETIRKVFDARGIKAQNGVSTTTDLRDSIRFEALNGDKAAARMLSDIENGNAK